ncbi:hypothetical protein IAU60_004821 [Kwoniella sp. DSM 27419]
MTSVKPQRDFATYNTISTSLVRDKTRCTRLLPLQQSHQVRAIAGPAVEASSEMNTIREINRINERELQLGVKGSWHDEYKDSAYVFIGGLAYELTEGDVLTIFSQWGEIMDVNLPRDKETGKTKGFGFLMYEDQRSTVLAVDNMNGAQVLGRTIRVDHTRNYRQPGKRNEEGEYEEPEGPTYNAVPPVLEGSESEESSEDEADSLDEEDPMAAFLRAEKKAQKKLTMGENGKEDKKKRKREGETKEERKRRKEEKRAKKEEKKRRKGDTGSSSLKAKELKVKKDPDEGDDRHQERRSRVVEEPRGDDRRREERREGRDRWDDRKGRADRDDWRDGKFELEREEKERERARERDDGSEERYKGDRRRLDDRARHEGNGRDRRAPESGRSRPDAFDTAQSRGSYARRDRDGSTYRDGSRERESAREREGRDRSYRSQRDDRDRRYGDERSRSYDRR